jgi:O-antigen/teichoic acid export membrane protein
MSRTRKAALTAGFAYTHYACAIASGLILIPLTLSRIGSRDWGLWLATGELVGYAAMVDLGVLGVLPWMLAQADGRNDREAMQRLVSHGVLFAAVIGVGYVALAAALWGLLPTLLRMTPADRAELGPPLALLVGVNALSYPLRVFRGVLGGLQDVTFNGALTLAQSSLTFAITVVLLVQGYGLYALAAGLTVPALVVCLAALLRTLAIAPDLVRGWSRPALRELQQLMSNGVGVWFGALGWQLQSSSTAIVITWLGRPELVPIFACTSKLSSMSTQLAWVLPDSGLVGLAQLSGEQRPRRRVQDVVMMMLRLHLLLAGGAACVILAFNPAFVSAWVGREFFGGLILSALLASGIVVHSLVHGLMATASVLGNRLAVGTITIVCGVAQTMLAIVLGRIWGLEGIVAAALGASLAIAVPAGVSLLRPLVDLNRSSLARDLMVPWLSPSAGVAVVAAIVGLSYQVLGVVMSGVLSAAVGLAYVWQMRSLYRRLPLGDRTAAWLVRLKLLPPPVALADHS